MLSDIDPQKPSRRPVQSGWECAYHEAKLLQNHCFQSLPSRRAVPEKGTRLETLGSSRMALLIA